MKTNIRYEFFDIQNGERVRRNGGWCDTDSGPCACGAWHNAEEIHPDHLLNPELIGSAEFNPWFQK